MMLLEKKRTQTETITVVSAWHELAGIEADVTEWVQDARTGRTLGAWVVVTGEACADAGKDPATFAQRIGPNHLIFLSATEIARAESGETEYAA